MKNNRAGCKVGLWLLRAFQAKRVYIRGCLFLDKRSKGTGKVEGNLHSAKFFTIIFVPQRLMLLFSEHIEEKMSELCSP